jgi:hypothetical protein
MKILGSLRCQALKLVARIEPRKGMSCGSGKFVIRAPVEEPSIEALLDATPLLEKKPHALVATLLHDVYNPLSLHGPGAAPTFAPHDYPVNS